MPEQEVNLQAEVLRIVPNETKEISPESRLLHPLSVKEAVDLLFFSFRFSQGAFTFQTKLFRAIKALHPEYIFPKKIFAQALAKAIERHGKFIFSGSHTHTTESIGEDSIEENSRDLLIEMKKIFNDPKSPQKFREKRKKNWFDGLDYTHTSLEQDVLEGILQLDLRYLRKGRPERTHASKVHAHDKYLSMFCVYVLQSADTHCCEFNDLFRQLKALVSKKVSTGEWTEQSAPILFDVVNAYNEKHSDLPAVKLPVSNHKL